MKIYVVCDLEGVAGVIHHHQQCCWDLHKEWFARYYEQARRLATLELNALVEGALAGGAKEIVAWDGHGGFPGALDVELLHPECKLVMGAGDAGPVGLDESFDAMFQCGLHAMAGTPRAIMCHSFWGGITGYWVNGMAVGEIWMNAYMAGKQGVPFVFISGDKAAAAEAKKLVGDVETAVVKEGLSQQVRGLGAAPGISLAPKKARDVIREAAKRAMGKIGGIAPYTMEPPFVVRAQFTEMKHAETFAMRPGVKWIDRVTVEMKDAEQPFALL